MHFNKLVYSFDVFDTCLTRIYARPTDLFYDLAPTILSKCCKNGFDEVSISNFVRLRQQSERRTRNINRLKQEDINLRQIY